MLEAAPPPNVPTFELPLSPLLLSVPVSARPAVLAAQPLLLPAARKTGLAGALCLRQAVVAVAAPCGRPLTQSWTLSTVFVLLFLAGMVSAAAQLLPPFEGALVVEVWLWRFVGSAEELLKSCP